MATVEVTPMLDAAASVEDVSIPSVDSATPASETSNGVPAVESKPDSAADKAVKDEDPKPAETKVLSDAVVAFTPKEIVEKLSEIKKTDPALAQRLHQEVKNSLEAKRFLREVAPEAKDWKEAAKILSERVAPETKEALDAVAATDELLYSADPRLWDNVIEDLKASEHPEAFGELAPSYLSKLKEHDPEAYVSVQRSVFLDSAEETGLLSAVNRINAALSKGDTNTVKSLMKSISQLFKEEIAKETTSTKTRTEANTKAAETTTAAVEALRTLTTAEVKAVTNKVLGSFLGTYLQKELKGVPRDQLTALAVTIQNTLNTRLAKDNSYVEQMSKLYAEMKTPAQKTNLMKLFEAKLKTNDFGKKLVEELVKKQFPDRFKTAPVAPNAPATKHVTIGGKSQTVFQLATRPSNLVRTDTNVGGRMFTVKDLELLQTAKGIGLVPNRAGKGFSFVQWQR